MANDPNRTFCPHHHPSVALSSIMGRGKAISEEVQWIIIRLSTKLNQDEISMYVGVSIRSVERIIAHFKHNQDVLVRRSTIKERRGKLGEAELEVSGPLYGCHILNNHCFWQHMFNAVNNVPDIYLDELQMDLQDTFGVAIDKSTIWRKLRRGGYTMKKVCIST